MTSSNDNETNGEHSGWFRVERRVRRGTMMRRGHDRKGIWVNHASVLRDGVDRCQKMEKQRP